MTIGIQGFQNVVSKIKFRRNLKRLQNGTIEVDEVLSNRKALPLFFQHLTSEFAIELLLAFVSFTRFQRCLLKSFSDHLSIIMPLTHLPRCPTTKIVSMIINTGKRRRVSFEESENEIETEESTLKYAKIEAHELYHYFIAVGSKYEINISGEQRGHLANILDDKLSLMENNNITSKELVLLFEDIKLQMLHYLQDSFVRFQEEPQFQTVLNYL